MFKISEIKNLYTISQMFRSILCLLYAIHCVSIHCVSIEQCEEKTSFHVKS